MRNKKEIGWVSVEEKLESFFFLIFPIFYFSSFFSASIADGIFRLKKKKADVESLLVVVCVEQKRTRENNIEFFFTLILASVRAKQKNLFYYFKWKIIGGKTEEKGKI